MFLSYPLFVLFAAAEPSVVFLGNSYTQYNNLPSLTSSLLQENVAGWDEIAYQTLTAGGLALDDHAARVSRSDSEWSSIFQQTNDIYILQDQSQTPAFGEGVSYFDNSLAGLIEIQEVIEQQEAMTVLFLTWGRRDGDNQNPDWFPDYETMQEALNDGYLKYAERASNRSQVYIAPIGPIFGAIKLQDEALFRDLYSQDGSHPSELGSTTTALGLVASLTGRSPAEISTDLEAEEEALIKATVEQVILEDSVGHFPMPWVWDSVPEDGLVAHELMRPLLLLDENYEGDLNIPDGRLWLEGGRLQATVSLGEQSQFKIEGGEFLGNINGAVSLVSGGLQAESISGSLIQQGGSIFLVDDLMIGESATLKYIELIGEEACITAPAINIDNLEVSSTVSWEIISGDSEILCLAQLPATEPSSEPEDEAFVDDTEDSNSSTTKDSSCSGSGGLIVLSLLGFFRRRT